MNLQKPLSNSSVYLIGYHGQNRPAGVLAIVSLITSMYHLYHQNLDRIQITKKNVNVIEPTYLEVYWSSLHTAIYMQSSLQKMISTQPIVTPEPKGSENSGNSNEDVPTVFEIASDIQQKLQDLLRKVNDDDVQFNKFADSINDRLKNLEEWFVIIHSHIASITCIQDRWMLPYLFTYNIMV